MTTALLEMQLGLGETLKTSVVGFVVVLVILAVIALLIKLISAVFTSIEKAASKKKTADAPIAAAPSAASGRQLSATESQGELKLENVDEPTAAVIMAIVSNQSGIPLNRLAFKSIKLIEEK